MTIQSEEIKVGDIVKVGKNEQFPCDLVLLSSSNSNGKCFVMTANLDGETNLKPLFASRETKDSDTPELLANLVCQVSYDSAQNYSNSTQIRLCRLSAKIPIQTC